MLKFIESIYYSRLMPHRLRRILGTFYFLNFELGRPYYASKLLPGNFRWSLKTQNALAFDYGYLPSIKAMVPIDAESRPLPWYTYPAIDFLRQLDFREKTVFEYGSGHSTLFWGTVAKKVVSVENDEAWHERIAPKLAPNCELVLATTPEAYITSIRNYSRGFDVIVVDGLPDNFGRYKAAREAVRHLNQGGLIILDNSDWLPASSRFLRDSGLLEVDMTGPGPVNRYMWTTSLFFHRMFDFPSNTQRRPMPGIGGVDQIWEMGQPPDVADDNPLIAEQEAIG
jgi:hypothetical protein